MVPLGADGSYMVFERLDNPVAIKRRGGDGKDAAETMKRLRALGTLGEVRVPLKSHTCKSTHDLNQMMDL